ncbi:MAG: RNA polymerase sigma factor [Chitinophagaceae bacterium]
MKAIANTCEIVELIILRDRKGFNLLYDQFTQMVFGVSNKFVRNKEAAEDLVQETFIKVWKNINQFDPDKASFSTWLLNIARYTAIDYLRSKSYKQQLKNQNLENSEYQYKEPAISYFEERAELRGLIATLEYKYRIVLDLIYFAGYTQEETAQLLNIPLGTVKTRTRFAIQTLRADLIQ